MITLRSPAKVNWYLQVLNRRADGYHNITTVLQEIDLADELTMESVDGDRCVVEGLPEGISATDNLITRAWQAVRDASGRAGLGVRVRVNKIIPAGGGLGGGSSNAAATLKGLNELFGIGMAPDEMETIGAGLGSDVPFFVRGGCAVARGRGTELERVRTRAGLRLGLVFPRVRVSTAEAYSRLGRTMAQVAEGDLTRVLDALERGDEAALSGLVRNDFETLVAEEPWFAEARIRLAGIGASRVFLCGSGSTVAGLIPANISLEKPGPHGIVTVATP